MRWFAGAAVMPAYDVERTAKLMRNALRLIGLWAAVLVLAFASRPAFAAVNIVQTANYQVTMDNDESITIDVQSGQVRAAITSSSGNVTLTGPAASTVTSITVT